MLCSQMFAVIVSVVVLSVVTDVAGRYMQNPEIHRGVLHRKVITKWADAKQRCEREGAVLSSLIDEEMLEYMQSSIDTNNHTMPYFIGIEATANPELILATLEGVPLDDLPEAALIMIDQLNPQVGICMGLSRGNIRVVSCRSRQSYICYKNDTTTSTTTVQSVEVTLKKNNCGSGYTLLSGSYYKLHKKPATWDNAQSTCVSEGAYLAVLNNEQEARTVKDFAYRNFYPTWIFVGVRDYEKDGNWRSVLGDPLDQIYHTWGPSTTRLDCGSLDFDALLDDLSCLWAEPFICEKHYVAGWYVRHPEIHRSVLHKKVIATWADAKQRCEKDGVVMASPIDKAMLEYMKSFIGVNNHTTPYFIGIEATANPELIFATLEGIPLDDLPEAALNMIEQLDPQDGDCLSMDRDNIRVVSCRARIPYICYKNDTTTSATTVKPVDVTTDSETEVTTDTDCGSGYTFLSGNYYKVHKEPVTWDDAQSTCISEEAYLAVLNNEQKALTVKHFALSNMRVVLWMFIRVRDREENGNWRSVLGDPLDQIYHTWGPEHSNLDCGSINYDGDFEDIDCLWKEPFICEKHC